MNNLQVLFVTFISGEINLKQTTTILSLALIVVVILLVISLVNIMRLIKKKEKIDNH
mgnify:CR=1 FL=1